MKTPGLAVSPTEERGFQHGAKRSVAACAFCRKRLAHEYFFTCIRCDTSYCYIHMSRHQKALCARQAGRRVPDSAPLVDGGRLLLAGPEPRPSSSANV
jgi:hypothetical protein